MIERSLQPDLSGFPAGQVGQPFYGWYGSKHSVQPVSTGLFSGFSHRSIIDNPVTKVRGEGR
jgi:hypothetical protein